MNTPRNVLVPVDFSDTSHHALDYARALAEPFNATLHVLHVVVDPYSQPWAAEAGLDLPKLVETWKANAERRLGELPLETANAQLVTRVGEPFVEIVRYAQVYDIGLIVMGTHGRGPIGHMLLGSVAEKVVRKAPCPVLTVRHPDHHFEHPAHAA